MADYHPDAHPPQLMPQQQYPHHVPQHMVQQQYPPPQYPHHVPPHHVPPQTKGRRRRSNPPASSTKLHRPIIRFYCNDCKKKFRSRILANRNNNAVQHYCQLYQKIITRKVDSHSNKCKGDHGMGPCVVKRTDEDPDSDGEDETKAAYYQDKGKTPKSPRKPRATPSKKRKRKDDGGAGGAKRARMDPRSGPPPMEGLNGNGQSHGDGNGITTTLPAPPDNAGYYSQHGYVHPVHVNGSGAPLPQPPPMDFVDGGRSNSIPPMAMATDSTGHGRGDRVTRPLMATNSSYISPRIDDPMASGHGPGAQMAVPPPPPLEEFDCAPSPAAQPPLPPMEDSKSPSVPVAVTMESAKAEDKGERVAAEREEMECKGDEVGTAEVNGDGVSGTAGVEEDDWKRTEPKIAKGDSLLVEVDENGNAGAMVTIQGVGGGNVESVQTVEETVEETQGVVVDDDECINDGNTEDEDDLDLVAPLSSTPKTGDVDDELNLEIPM